MSMEMSNREVFTQIVERDIGNLYSTIRKSIFENIPVAFKAPLTTFIQGKEKSWISWLQEKTDMMIETIYSGEDIPVEEAMKKANVLIRDMIKGFLSEKTGFSDEYSNIIISIILGT